MRCGGIRVMQVFLRREKKLGTSNCLRHPMMEMMVGEKKARKWT